MQSKIDDNQYEEIRLLRKELLNFLMEISSYYHQAFETEGFLRQTKNIEPYCYYFGDAISLYKNRASFVGQGLSICEDESYWKSENIKLEET